MSSRIFSQARSRSLGNLISYRGSCHIGPAYPIGRHRCSGVLSLLVRLLIIISIAGYLQLPAVYRRALTINFSALRIAKLTNLSEPSLGSVSNRLLLCGTSQIWIYWDRLNWHDPMVKGCCLCLPTFTHGQGVKDEKRMIPLNKRKHV